MAAYPDKLAALRLYITVEHTCSYLPERTARNLVADPEVVDQDLYNQLARLGFRRSGGHIYRPHCTGCTACLSLRIPAQRFQPNRSQQRTWRKNQDLTVTERYCTLDPEHYRLFRQYLHSRHRGGGMDETSPANYLSFITSSWSDTRLYEFRSATQLIAVAVVDYLDDGLSAVYTFFEPEARQRGLGTYVILWQIAHAAQLGLDWVYLGYWIEQSEKMSYKAKFHPHEVYRAGRWLSEPG